MKKFLRLIHLYLLLGNYKVVQSSIVFPAWLGFSSLTRLYRFENSLSLGYQCWVQCRSLYYIVQKPVVLYQKSNKFLLCILLCKKTHVVYSRVVFHRVYIFAWFDWRFVIDITQLTSTWAFPSLLTLALTFTFIHV